MEKRLIVRDPNQLTQWAERIETCHNSGKSVVEWCRQNGINPKTYYYWNRRVLQMSEEVMPDASGFYEFPRSYETSSTGEVAGTIKVGSIKVDVYKGADAETLVSIIKAMQLC